jgi:hypothetical protein
VESAHVSLEEYENHEGENMVRSPFETQSCDLFQTRIVQEVESIQQKYHHLIEHTQHLHHDQWNQTDHHHDPESENCEHLG